MNIPNSKPQVIIIADSTGETAETVMRASLSQFGLKEVDIKKYPQIEEPEQVVKIIDYYRSTHCLIAFSLILPELKETLKEEAKKYNLPLIDIMGHTIEKISEFLGISPRLKPGAFREIDKTYYKRIEAIEHAVRCDDGKDLRTLFKGELIILGISRTSKTPLCMYLAYHGIKAGNLPLVPEVIPPKELYTLDPEKVFGLVIDPEELHRIRKQRLKAMRLDNLADYAQVKRIYDELEYSQGIFKKIGCHVINVTNQSIEETASEIIAKRGVL